MKTDTLFYNLFQTFPNVFFELIGQLTDALTQQEIIEFI
ncbi:MAG: DUF2887 domain-containing protein [Nostoc sp. TH1S01]|nr:DUF2887 domain-containing protein [Nostoc sp. TH1S01]